jgi:hypothetical protein
MATSRTIFDTKIKLLASGRGTHKENFEMDNEPSRYDVTVGKTLESFVFWLLQQKNILFVYKRMWTSKAPRQSTIPRYMVEIIRAKVRVEPTTLAERREMANPTDYKIRYKLTLTETKEVNYTRFKKLMEKVIGEGTCLFVEDENM